jgi:hypothetical protein
MERFVVDPESLNAGARELSLASSGVGEARRHHRSARPDAAGHAGLARAVADAAALADLDAEDLADETDDLATRLHAASRLYRGTDDQTAGTLR